MDGGGVFHPAVTQFAGANSETVGTPAIDSGVFGDVYLTVTEFGGVGPATAAQPFPNLPAGAMAIGVVVEPLLAWLWAGGLLIGAGGLLALSPGRRRRPTDPVSSTAGRRGTVERAPAPEVEPEAVVEGSGEPEPVGTAGR